ncbi:hypothetical protein F5884DRAFT_817639 [Xylogone sp. PMI_703]|nr:hypothetical protein F5884DRAFT_817639 [Xylogone sp. PMI_703]
MALPIWIQEQWLLVLGSALLLVSIGAVAVTKSGRQTMLNNLHFRRRRTSGARTPPRSISPEKKEKGPGNGSPASNLQSPDFPNTLPPSRRAALADVRRVAGIALPVRPEPTEEDILRDQIPMTRSYELENKTPKYTPTGFSTEEIKALGDFPPYDILSGVPLPQPYTEFDPAKALPRPYRPFRWQYHQTMSLTKMEPDWWLEIENTYIDRVKQRQDLYAQYGKRVLQYLPGSELACKEIMEMCLQFYCARYPQYFSLSEDKKTFHNRILKTDTDIKSMHPLEVLINNVPEDFGIMLRNDKDGMYYFRAGVICSSLGWNVDTKIGMQLREIHNPIPDYKEKMQFSMDRFFSKMPVNSPIQRGSWGLEIGEPLFMPAGHPHEKFREMQKEDLTIDECNLRVDWQTLRRLPLSSAIVFNFKALFTPVTEFRDEPYIPALVVKIMKEGKKNLMEYKNTWHVEHVCMPELEKYMKEQVEKGLVKPENPEDKEWNVTTLDESPYFPGWEEKWHRQQGY